MALPGGAAHSRFTRLETIGRALHHLGRGYVFGWLLHLRWRRAGRDTRHLAARSQAVPIRHAARSLLTATHRHGCLAAYRPPARRRSRHRAADRVLYRRLASARIIVPRAPAIPAIDGDVGITADWLR